MRLWSFAALFVIVTPALVAAEPIRGFSATRAEEQQKLERSFDASLDATNLRDWMKQLTRRPHHAGSPFGKEVAEIIAGKFRSWGYDTTIEEFQVLFPTPKLRKLELLAPNSYSARLEEPILQADTTSALRDEQLPLYNAYSRDGDVTGELVYVNYGIPKDYEELERRGIDVKGKIVIARYGGSWRGIKPKVAAEHGAIGCIIYSDPRDDGYFQGDVYPGGAWKMESGGQRGSVADMPLFPGDPLTPGIGATASAKRLTLAEAPTLTKIPVLPIPYGDALPLLKALGGPVAPEAWRGALPITYHLGPGPAKVHLQVAFDWKVVPIYDVIAKLRGSELPDEWVIRGNHHDAWVFGADDPISGMVALMEEARAIALLTKRGWKPKRTLVYAAWDAEEPGLLGSTEWAETHADELRQKAAVYINTDSNGRGFFYAAGSHTLERLVNEVARDVPDPQKGVSILARVKALRIVTEDDEDAAAELATRRDLRIEALGSGSDYTPFLQHLGIASLHLGFGGEDGGGSYHSIYDSFDHYTRFGDPKFEYGIALAKTAGRAVLRLANADALPLEISNFADTVSRYLKEVSELAGKQRKETEKRNRQIEEGHLAAVADPTETFVMPKLEDPTPFFDFSSLENAVARLEKSAKAYDKEFEANHASLSPDARKQLDSILMGLERQLTRSEGLPGRPWFKHYVYAPGFYTGYGVKTLPTVREAIEQKQWATVNDHARDVARLLLSFADQVDRAAEIVERR